MKNSNKILLTLAMVFASVFSYAQDTETRKLDKFYELKVAEGIELIAQKGSENKIELEVDYIDIENVLTKVSGGRLHVHLERGRYRRKRIKAILTYTEELDEIHVTTAAEVTFKNELTAKSMEISVSTSGYLEIKSIKADRLELIASTSGRIDIEGNTDRLGAKASTGAVIYAYDLDAKEVTAKANTGGDIRISAEDFLTAKANTGGSVKYKGKPTTDVSTNTGGSIQRSN